jgi:uncharacterized cupredoxin-like copper-binding protein
MPLITALVAFLAGCGGTGTPATSVAPVPQAQAPAAAQAPVPTPAAQAPVPVQAPVAVTVSMTDYAFEPSHLTVPLGAQVRVTVVNAGQHTHDFNVVGSYGVEGDILEPGQQQVLTFVADRAGTFRIVCSQNGHADKGMVADLIVQ